MEAIVIAIIGSGALSTLISCIFALVREKRAAKQKESEEFKVLREGLQQLMYDRIKYLCKTHISRGYIASNDLEDLERMHKTYHDKDKLNGNGFLDDLMEAVHELDIIPVLPH